MPKAIDEYCNLYGVETDTALSVLLAQDGSFCTLIRVHGTATITSPEDMADALEHRFGDGLAALMEREGHLLSIVFERHANTEGAAELAHERMLSRAHAKALSLDAVIEETASILRDQPMVETILIACWTRPEAAGKTEIKRDRQDLSKTSAAAGPYAPALATTLRLQALDGIHGAFVGAVASALTAAGILHEILGPGEEGGRRTDLFEIRSAFLPHQTPPEWVPIVDPTPAHFQPRDDGPETGADGFFPPPISHQILSADAEASSDHTELRLGGRRHAFAVMTLFPSVLPPFNLIPAALVRPGADTVRMPFRITFHLESGPWTGGWKKVAAGLLAWSSPPVMNFFRAVQGIDEAVKRGRIRFAKSRIVATTWTEPHEPAELLPRRRAALVRALTAWGAGGIAETAPDPMRTLAETVPGALHTAVSAPATVAPVGELAKALPFHRPAPAFPTGETAFVDLAGKTFWHEAGSPRLLSWLTLIAAKPGSGKSVLMNRLNHDFVAYRLGRRLPLLGIIDLGISSTGLIATLRNALPPHRQHEVSYVRLLKDKSYAINPFDLGLGRRTPLDREAVFLRNFLRILFDMEGQELAKELIGQIIARAYRQKSDLELSGQPARWQEDIEPDIDSAARSLGVPLGGKLTWWQLADHLIRAGHIDLSARAQRHAAPTLADVAAILATPDMIRDFGDDLCRRARLHVVDAIDAYPIFANPTVLDLGEARVTSIDLQDVAIRDPSSDEAKRNNALMFMIARHLFVRRFAGHAEEIPLMELSADPEVRQCCRRYWSRFLSEMQEVEKRMAMDEVHITGTGPAMSSQVDSDAREGRKWGLQIILASQRLDDFRNLRDLASAVFLLNAETGEIRRHTAEVFGFGAAVEEAMVRYLHGPRGRQGANFLANYKLDSGERWIVLNNRVPPRLLWALTTVKEDRLLRDALYQELSVDEALTLLARRFPDGSALSWWRRFENDAGDDSVARAAAAALAAEHHHQAILLRGNVA